MSSLFGIGANGASDASFYDESIDQSLRFEDGDSAYLSRTPSSAGNLRTFTWSGWVKRGNLGLQEELFVSDFNSAYAGFHFQFDSNDRLYVYQLTTTTSQIVLITNAVFRDTSNWYHIVLAVDTTDSTADDRVKLYVNGSQITSFSSRTNPSLNLDTYVNSTSYAHYVGTGRTANEGLRGFFDGYMAEVNFIDGTALTPTSFGETKNGVWIPKAISGLTYGTNGFRLTFADSSDIGNNANSSDGTNDYTPSNLDSTDVVLDSPTNNFAVLNPLVVSNNTNDNTFKEGNLEGTTGNNAGGNITGSIAIPSSGKWYFEFRPMDIGNGVFLGLWDPDPTQQFAYSVTPSIIYESVTGGLRLNGTSPSYGATFGTSNTIGVAVDVDNGTVTFYKDNSSQGSTNFNGAGLFPVINDWYTSTNIRVRANFGQDSTFSGARIGGGATSDTGFDYSAYISSTQFRVNGGWNNAGGAPASGMPAVNDTIQFTNTSNQSVGSSQGGTDFTVTAITQQSSGSSNAIVTVNRSTLPQVVQPSLDTGSSILSVAAGSIVTNNATDDNGIGNFVYAPPSGHLALCSANLPEPTLSGNAAEQPDDHFNTVLYSGTGSTRSVTGVGFQPDFIWIKRRDGGANHALYDSTRGGTNALRSNVATHESQYGDAVITFQADGFQVAGSNVSGVNGSSQTFSSWNWKLNGGTTATNNDGNVTSTVQANTDAGTSIVTFPADNTDGRTVGHGLGVAPKLIITKNRANPGYGSAWIIYSEASSAGHYMFFTGAVRAANTSIWGNTAPTSSVFTVGNATAGYGTGGANDVIAYCFADVEGYQKIGSYNGNAGKNTFIYTGFRPQFFMAKNTTTANGNWLVFDDVRDTDNPIEKELWWNISDQEYNNGRDIDFVSNGIKLRASDNNNLTSTDTYLFLAIARQPFKYSNAF